MADRPIEFTDYVRPVCLPNAPVDDQDYLADDFVTLAGWGLQYSPETGNYKTTSQLKLHTLQVYTKDDCDDIFSPDSLSALNIPVHTLRQIRNGFQKDISCVGNEWQIGVGRYILDSICIVNVEC